MENEVTQSADFFRLVAWLNANQKRVTWICAAILVVGAGIGIYIWHGNYREAQASEALSNVKLPASAEETLNPASAEPYLKVADEYPGTSGGGRAVLIAGGILFDAGKFDQSQALFERFLREHPDYPLATQAILGVAASLEAQGKTAEAAARYEDLIKRQPTDSTIPQAKSALARLDLAQNKPESALHLYEELARANNNDSWSAEAGIQREELLAKYPNLKKAPAPAPSATVTMPPSAAAPVKP